MHSEAARAAEFQVAQPSPVARVGTIPVPGIGAEIPPKRG